MSRKQERSKYHTRSNLRTPEEIPLEEPEPEPEAKEPLPPHRLPYTLKITSHFPDQKHLHEESEKRIEEKVAESMLNFEDLIRRIDVHLEVSDNFHRSRDGAKHRKFEPIEDDSSVVERVGSQMVAPYLFKASVALANHRTIVLGNAEKHAQPTLTEALDHMVHVMKKAVREEKDKMLEAKKRAMDTEEELEDMRLRTEDEKLEADELAEEIAAQEDKVMEAMYRRIESERS
jgi:hypothetical protein